MVTQDSDSFKIKAEGSMGPSFVRQVEHVPESIGLISMDDLFMHSSLQKYSLANKHFVKR